MKSNYTHAAILLDRSGSMTSIKHDVIGGINEFIEKQKKVPGEMSVSILSFASHRDYTWIYDKGNINVVSNFTTENYHPSGNTALNDALGLLIETTGKNLAELPDSDRPEKVLVVVITDGEENDSREYSTSDIKRMIEHQREKYNWEFLYIGANQDSFAEAQKRGMSKAMNYKANSAGVRGMSADLDTFTTSYRTGK